MSLSETLKTQAAVRSTQVRAAAFFSEAFRAAETAEDRREWARDERELAVANWAIRRWREA